MSFPPTTPSPTYRLVWNRDALRSDRGDPTVATENAVLRVAFEYGTSVHIAVDERMLRNSHPTGFEAVQRLDSVPGDERLFQYDDERRARLPGHADELATILDFGGDGTDRGVWACRLFGVDEFAVLDGERWRYHSIPHHTWCRELFCEDDTASVTDGEDAPGFLADVERALEGFPGVAVFSVEPLCSWRAAGTDYELTPERLSVDTGESTHSYRLGSLDYVHADPSRLELACGWQDREASSLPKRLVRWVVEHVGTEPPTRLRFETPGELHAATDALRTLRSTLDYEFRVQ